MSRKIRALLAGCVSAIAMVAIPAGAGATVDTFGPSTPGPNAVPAAPDSGNAQHYPWDFVVSGLPGLTDDVNLTLTGLAHNNVPDLDLLLVAPNGAGGVVVMSDVGDATDIAPPGVDLAFDDSAPGAAPVGTALSSGSYRPTDDDSGLTDTDLWGPPAPVGPFGSTLSFLNGFNPNGTWSLYIVDDGVEVGSTGAISDAALTVSTQSSGQPPTATNPNAGPKPKKAKKKCKHKHPHTHGRGVGQIKHNHKHKCHGKHHKRQPH